MSRYDLTDFEWRLIEPLLPNKPHGVLGMGMPLNRSARRKRTPNDWREKGRQRPS
jgi:transposase